MTSENVKTLEKIYDGFRRRDFSFVDKYFDADVEIVQSELLPWGGRYRGHTGVQDFFAKMLDKIDATLKPEHFLDDGDHVVQVGHSTAKVKHNGKTVTVPEVHVWHFKNGKAASIHCYVDTPPVIAALKA